MGGFSKPGGSGGGGSGGGSWSLVTSLTASASASLDFTDLAADEVYKFEFDQLLGNGTEIHMRMSDDNGATFSTGTYIASQSNQQGSSTTLILNQDTTSALVLTGTNVTNVSGALGLSGELRLFQQGDASAHTGIMAFLVYCSAANTIRYESVVGSYFAAAAIDAVQFYSQTGNLASGTVYLYKLVKA